jgi:hypothetical protein
MMDTFTMSAAAFVELVSAAAFASTDKARPLLTGVLLERGEGNTVRAIATDSYGLVMVDRDAETIEGDATSVILSAVDLMRVAKSAKRGEVTLSRVDSRGYLAHITGGDSIRVEVIEGTYPAYRQLIPAARGISEGSGVGFAPELLVKLSKVAPFSNKMTGEAAKLVALIDSSRPFMFESRDGRTTALFMPVRAS